MSSATITRKLGFFAESAARRFAVLESASIQTIEARMDSFIGETQGLAATDLPLNENSSNRTVNGALLELMASTPIFSLAGQTVSIGLRAVQRLPSLLTKPEILLPRRSMRR